MDEKLTSLEELMENFWPKLTPGQRDVVYAAFTGIAMMAMAAGKEEKD
jgi:hypothetical protein